MPNCVQSVSMVLTFRIKVSAKRGAASNWIPKRMNMEAQFFVCFQVLKCILHFHRTQVVCLSESDVAIVSTRALCSEVANCGDW